jgi:serine/threonine protein kinase
MEVLYSRKDEAWKLCDFGYTTELKSRSNLGTASARGTEGYFPPEFFAPGDVLYDTKVDIWAMGCILFELVMTKRAFESNSAIFEYRASAVLPTITPDEYFSQQDLEDTTTCVGRMLKIDPSERPTASESIELFLKHLQNSPSPQTETTIQIRHEFSVSALSSQFTSLQLVSPIAAVRKVKPDLAMIHSAIEKNPRDYWSWHALIHLYSQQHDLDGAIKACETALSKDPFNPSPMIEVANLYAAKADFPTALLYGMRLSHLKSADIRSALSDPQDSLLPSVADNFDLLLASFQGYFFSHVEYANSSVSKVI